jgi:MipA family protein
MARASLACGGTTLAALAAAGVCTLLPMPVHAQDDAPGPDAPMTGNAEVMVGLGVFNAPAYLGSDERKTRALPALSARWKSGWFAGIGGSAGTGGLGYRFNTGTPLSWGLRLTIDPGRDEDDADALRGMGDIKARPELGAFASYALRPGLRLGAALRAGSGNDRNGVLVDVGLRGVYPIAASHWLTGGVVATFANTKAMQSSFGVDAAQSLHSGYAIYSSGSGLRDISVQFGNMVTLAPQWTLMLGVNARSLMGDAKSSPLTRERTGVSAFATLSYRL